MFKAPSKNFLIYDADCGFCEASKKRLEKIIAAQIDYVPRQSLEHGFYGIDSHDTNRSIKFFQWGIENLKITDSAYQKTFADAVVYSAAYAVFKALSYSPQKYWSVFLKLYLYVPGFSICAEAVYSIVSRYRSEISAQCKI